MLKSPHAAWACAVLVRHFFLHVNFYIFCAPSCTTFSPSFFNFFPRTVPIPISRSIAWVNRHFFSERFVNFFRVKSAIFAGESGVFCVQSLQFFWGKSPNFFRHTFFRTQAGVRKMYYFLYGFCNFYENLQKSRTFFVANFHHFFEKLSSFFAHNSHHSCARLSPIFSHKIDHFFRQDWRKNAKSPLGKVAHSWKKS